MQQPVAAVAGKRLFVNEGDVRRHEQAARVERASGVR